MIRAHHMQAQTVRQRLSETASIWLMLDEIVSEHHLPDRATDLLYDAVLGYRLRRSTYVRKHDLEARTATRDFGRLMDAGLLEARGMTKGRYYVAGTRLRQVRREVRSSRRPLDDPYPRLVAELSRS